MWVYQEMGQCLTLQGVVLYLALPLLLSTEAIIALWFADVKKESAGPNGSAD